MPGQFWPRGLTMLDCSKNRTGFDRVLMAVAATSLTVSATSAVAQNDPPRNSAAELATITKVLGDLLATERRGVRFVRS